MKINLKKAKVKRCYYCGRKSLGEVRECMFDSKTEETFAGFFCYACLNLVDDLLKELRKLTPAELKELLNNL